MRAIGYKAAGPVSDKFALVEFQAELPSLGPRDLLVEVRGVSVNPVDVKVRTKAQPENGTRILGFDAAGTVKKIGAEVSHFKVGDDVFYAGDITRQGSNAEFQAVDEQIVGRKPQNLGFAEAAGMPLTAITAWELLFDSLGVRQREGQGDAILIVGGAGGVGSILIQLAKKLTGLTVIATASRPDTIAWVKQLGADRVINHRMPLDEEIASLGISPRYVAALTQTETHFDAIVKLIKPRGHIALIDDPKTLDIVNLKQKALSVSWEFMFTRSMFQTADIEVQHKLLNRLAELLEDGTLVSTVNQHGGVLNVENLQFAHELQASGNAIGKTVLDGFA
ncbi:zinc-binding alcohol dehydrogenase family protein [Hirschia litorea]|uniref:Zinc-type alcohol dehydrogenase-like protein n=1 Tax=Hirschia litorea TaxID=1199156 RepID=A0ABW2IH68_9PROT